MYVRSCLYLFIISGKLVYRVKNTLKKKKTHFLETNVVQVWRYLWINVEINYIPYQLEIDFNHLFQCFESPFSLLSFQFQYLNTQGNRWMSGNFESIEKLLQEIVLREQHPTFWKLLSAALGSSSFKAFEL